MYDGNLRYTKVMIGIDEVGRGAWAGPLLVVATRLNGELPPGLRDSKLLTKVQRSMLMNELIENFKFGEGWVSPEEIDAGGLASAMRLGVGRALEELGANFSEEIIMDGSINYCSSRFSNVQCIVKADTCYPIVSAASIYAKVLRDRLMSRMALDYPGYGFERNVGYGTKLHIDALRRLGPTNLHRLSYRPIRQLL